MSSNNTKAAKHAKRGPKPFARVEVYAASAEIESKLACGHTLRSAWEDLCESGSVHLTYAGFCYTWQRIKSKQIDNPKTSEDVVNFTAGSTSKSNLDARAALDDILSAQQRGYK